MKPLPKNEQELLKEATSLGLLLPNCKLTSPRCNLLLYINDSRKIQRSINFASILVVGSSGVGKSSTINHLLSFGGEGVQFAKTSRDHSETRTTSEYIFSTNEPKFQVEDLQLGIVDSPGFNDTDGGMQDACNFYSIKKFYETHPKLSGCYPNLIFLLVPCTDTRIGGTNSNLSKSLRCLKELHLVDLVHPNVVVILSFCCGVSNKNVEKWQEKLDDKKKVVQEVIFNALNVTAPVIFLENDYEEEQLDVSGDFTKLPDGTLQPQNLYNACQQILSKNKDNLGLVILNASFSNVMNGNPVLGHEVSVKNAINERLSQEEEEFVKFCERAARGGAPDPIIDRAQQFIKRKCLDKEHEKEAQEIAITLKRMGLQEVDCSRVSTGSFQYFYDEPISEIGTEMLEKEFTVVKKYAKFDSGRVLGQGYNILTDKPVAAQIMKFETHAIDVGIVIPTCAKFEKVNETRSFMDQYENEISFTISRLTNLNVSIEVDHSVFKMATRAGYNKTTDSQHHSSSSEYSLLFEQRMFELKIGNFKEYLEQGITFTADFESDVKALPSKYDKNDVACRNIFERFFNRFGHFIVTSAFGGGAIETKNNGQEYGGETLSFEEVKGSLSASYDGGIWSVASKVPGQNTASVADKASALLTQSETDWFGGDLLLHNKNTVQNQELMLKWRTSLLLQPTMLTTEMCLEPISTVISCISPQKDKASYEALKDLLGGEFKVIASREKDREQRKQKQIEDEEKRREAVTRAETIKDPDDGGASCFPSSALVHVVKNRHPVCMKMSEVCIGDKVIAWDYKRHCTVATEVIMFAHRVVDIKNVAYLKIVLQDGESITMSGNHLVMIKGSDKATMAKNVQKDEFLSLIDAKGCLVPKKVAAIEEVVESGLFSPVTNEGNIIVNNIVASCYCSISDQVFLKGLVQTSAHHVAHLFFLPMRVMYKLKVEWVGKLPENGSIHPYAKLLCKLNLPWTDEKLKVK